MNKHIFITFLLVAMTWGCYAQEKTSHFDRNRMTFGGNVGLGFSNHSTVINIAPQVGYFFTPQINAGAGISYTFYKYKNGETEKYNYAGLNIFGRYYLLQYIVLHIQPEINYMHHSYQRESNSEMVPVVIAGAGVHMGSFTFMLQYDVVQHNYSPYGSNLFYSVGFSF